MRLITKSGWCGSSRLGRLRTDWVPEMATVERFSTGTALPARLYRDPEVLELERKRIFERTWQLAAHVSQLPKPGTYVTAKAGTQPVLVLRDEEGVLRAFRNVCRHRGSRLLAGSGECGKAIRCLYHGWTYRTDGELIGVPEARTIPGLDKSELGLFPVRVETLCGLVFVNLDPHATPLAEQVVGLPERMAPYEIERLEPHTPYDGTQPANWKIAADNYLEGYHVPIAHPGLMRLLDYKHYDVEVHANWVWFEAPLRDKPSGNRMERLYQRLVSPMPGLGEGDRRVWRFIFIYPNTAIDLYPDLVWTWKIDADDATTTRDTAWLYRHPDASLRTRLAQRVNYRVNKVVGDEDFDLVSNVQEGIQTRGWEPGPLSGREAAIAWFADRIREDLGE
jgi:choline monooxygenase